MSGYRQSSYDPYAHERPGRPKRPYNWVQWIGAALIVASIATLLDYFAGRAGWVAPLVKQAQFPTALAILGSALVNSRREPPTPITPEGRRKRLLIVFAAIAIAVIFAALAYVLNTQGA